MKHTNKKGFTIVELVIVIAVIAILAAVLIPTFSNLIKKANESSDIQAVRQMNTFLAADGAVVATTPGRLLDVLKEGGFDAENYKPLVANRAFFWDRSLNQILYVDTTNGEVLFPKKVEANQATWYSLNGSTTLFGQTATVTLPAAPTADDGVAENKFAVANGADFIKVAEFIQQHKTTQNASGDTIVIELTGDINLQGADINFAQEATGGLNVVFKSSEEGVKRTISGLYISDQHATTGNDADGNVASNYGHSLFNHVKSLTVSDIAIEYSVIGGYGASQAGFFAGQVSGDASFTNVSVTYSDIQGLKKVGVLCGYTHGKVTFNNVVIDNCTVSSAQGEAGVVIGVVEVGAVPSNQNAVSGTITVTNSTVNVPNINTVKTVTDANGKQYTIVEYVENGETDWRIATANFAFWSPSQSLDKTSAEGTSFRAYTALDTLEAFLTATGAGAASND